MTSSTWLRAFLSVSALALGSSVYAQATLKEAVELAFKNNPDILIEVARFQASEEGLKRAQAGYLPRIDLSLGVGHEHSNNATTRAATGGSAHLWRRERALTLTQMLFDGKGVASEVARMQATTESAAFRAAGSADQVALKVVEHYIEVLRLNELVALTRDNVAAHEKTNDQITLRSTSGVGRRADQDQAEARLALARSNFVAAQANLRDAEINFKRFVGSLPQGLMPPPEPAAQLLPTRIDETVESAFFNSPFRKQAQADVAAATAQYNAARALRSPRLDLEVGATRNDNIAGTPGRNDSTYAMLRMRYTLYNGGADNARIAENRIRIMEAEEIVRRTEYQLEQNARLAWNAYNSANERLPTLKTHAESSTATREAYEKQFTIGQRSLLDLLDTENEYFTAQSEFVNGRYVALYARYRLLAETSKLVESLGVRRPEGALAAR